MAALRFNTTNSGEFTLASRKAAIVWIAAFALFGCGKNDQGAQPPAPAAMPVTVLQATPTSVPISAEAVAQTEGAKEV